MCSNIFDRFSYYLSYPFKYILQISRGVNYEAPKKIPGCYVLLFIAFWVLLFGSVVMTQIGRLPISVPNEGGKTDTFLGDRASSIQDRLADIGPKIVGSDANEIKAVELIKAEVEKIRSDISDYFEIDIDVQQATGNFTHWSMINMYQGIQNVVVRLSAKGSTDENYLLINSHFDSAVSSPGASDDGAMVSVMLEVLRVIARSNGPLKYPIVFLFNGAEETFLQGSHAFITQHKWAENCKGLINLDAAGSGGREMLFQSGPNNPWLMGYYRSVPHPFATTLAEEMFQANFIPSDTDFSIFRDYGNVPGLDMAYIFNGYVYHTEYDNYEVFPKRSLQNTGDNILYLAKAIANGPELMGYEEGHMVFYDFFGWFIVCYTETVGIIINSVVCFVAIAAIWTSLYFMSEYSDLYLIEFFARFSIIMIIHIFSMALGFALVALIAVVLDSVNCSMSWFSASWLLIGLYFCPMFFGMGILPAVYAECQKKDYLCLRYRIQLFMHSHCLFMVLVTIALTAFGIRSAFMPMIAVFFDVLAIIINLITTLYRKAYWFAIPVIVCQILPFLYFTSAALTFFSAMIPMQGRQLDNPDMIIAMLAGFFSIHFAGSIMPLFLFFNKTRTIICTFLGITALFIVFALTPLGFPYKEKTAPQRLTILHAKRTIHNFDNSIHLNQSGIYVNVVDRRRDLAIKYIRTTFEAHEVSEFCKGEITCAMPILDYSWTLKNKYNLWIPINEEPIIPSNPIELTKKSSEDKDKIRHFEFSLSGPDHMSIVLSPKVLSEIVGWSFEEKMIKQNRKPPYFIYYARGTDSAPFEFSIDVETENIAQPLPVLEIGVTGHWMHHDKNRTDEFQKLIGQSPKYACIDDWVAIYESWLF